MSDPKTSDESAAAEQPKASEGAGEVVAAPPAPALEEKPAPTVEAPAAASQPVVPADKDKKESGPPLIPRGNKLRWLRGGLTALLGSLLAFLLMAHNAQIRFGVPLGIVFCLVATWGVSDLLGTFDDPDERVGNRLTFGALLMPLGGMVSTTLMFLGAIALAAHGKILPQWAWGLLVTGTFIALAWAVFEVGVKLGPLATDEAGKPRSILRRHGFWVIVAAACLYLPFMGSFSLWDPWETHYGEVAREILARDDWVSLWWAQDGWFWSKPILNFWIQSISMASLGVHYMPDQMLAGASVSDATMQPEWVVRMPVVLLTILSMYILYKGVAKGFGRRAGLLGALVLATMPDWFFLAHQTMTDMPCIAAMTAAMGMLLIGLRSDADVQAKAYEVSFDWRTKQWLFGAFMLFGVALCVWGGVRGELIGYVVGGPLLLAAGFLVFRAVRGKQTTLVRFTGWHLVMGAVILCILPQILYLLSRNIELSLHGETAHGFRVHWDEFRKGSGPTTGGGNCGLPGNDVCALEQSASIPKSLVGKVPEGIGQGLLRAFGAVEPFVQSIFWIAVTSWLLYLNWGERRLRRLCFLGAYLFAAIATMGKGPEGVVLPAAAAFFYVCVTKQWKEFTRLEIVSGILIWLALALPWYVAMYVRHGQPFTDRLIFHDMFNRTFNHVHDTNEGDDTSFRFYLWQLGYAYFPWTGFAPLGLMWWMRRGDTADRGKGDTAILLFFWFLVAFCLFSFMGTKFHHYIFPTIPPTAMLIGIALDDMLGKRATTTDGKWLPAYLAGLTGGVALATIGVSRLFPGSIFGAVPMKDDKPLALAEPQTGVGVLCIVAGIAVLGTVAYLFRSRDTRRVMVERAAPYRDALKVAKTMPAGEAWTPRRAHESVMLAAAAVAGAFLLVLVGRDLAMKAEHPGDQPGAIRLLQLFTYNYKRPWPESLDFGAILMAFTVIAILLSIAMSVRAIRRHIVIAFFGFALLWGFWGTDVYMLKTAPHWGQHEVIQAYYANRTSTDELLVAYQMNWKGENFYTGNHIPAFVSTGGTFTTWLKGQRDKGAKVMFFVTEHNRIGGLKGEVQGKKYDELTTKEICNKFVMVRVEL